MCLSRGLAALVILLVWLASCAEAPVAERPDSDIDAPVKRFLYFYFHSYGRGLPEESQLPELAAFVTPELLSSFDAALRGEECYARKINNEGAPLVEGDLFSSRRPTDGSSRISSTSEIGIS